MDATQPAAADDLLFKHALRFGAPGKEADSIAEPAAPTYASHEIAAADKADSVTPGTAFSGQPIAMMIPSDSLFPQQWHLLNTAHPGIDLNVTKVWDDYKGTGIVVGLVDDGIDYNHSDLLPNYRSDLDYDARNNDF